MGSVVKINVLTVSAEMRETLEKRFASRAGAVENSDGFECSSCCGPQHIL